MRRLAGRAEVPGPRSSGEPVSQKPSVGRIVLVTTPMPFSGQRESAAIVTQVISDDHIHATLFPAGGEPFAVSDVYRAGHPYVGTYAWRWPERT